MIQIVLSYCKINGPNSNRMPKQNFYVYNAVNQPTHETQDSSNNGERCCIFLHSYRCECVYLLIFRLIEQLLYYSAYVHYFNTCRYIMLIMCALYFSSTYGIRKKTPMQIQSKYKYLSNRYMSISIYKKNSILSLLRK